MASDDYKRLKEAFVSDTTGSSITHINLISSVALTSLALHAAVRSRFHHVLNLSVEWVLLVLPLLLSITVFANAPGVLSALLLFAATAIYFSIPPKSTAPLPSHAGPDASVSSIQSPATSRAASSGTAHRIPVPPLPALTIYRSHMMLMTILGILAVDFPLFPRSLAKCETFGVSLMDLGVGSFVFSQGVVSSIPILRDPTYLAAPSMRKATNTLKKVLPLLILGVVRLISVKGTDYPEHESEYGRHWNFFFTMAFLPLLEVLLHPIIARTSISLVGFLVTLSHQCILSFSHLQDYTLHASRLGIVSSNKEGLVSLLGYLAIHLIGLSTGTVLLPPSPSDFRRYQKKHDGNGSEKVEHEGKQGRRQNDKTAIELFSYSFLWWASLGIASLLGFGSGVSRRLANMPYVLWISAFNTSFILCYLLLDMTLYSSVSILGKEKPQSSPGAPSKPENVRNVPSTLLDAMNTNGLAIFLLANVMTGLINLSISTMFASDAFALVILAAYSFTICAIAWATRRRKLW